MKAGDVVDIYGFLVANGVTVWVDGGWGVDALAHRETRPHKDLDLMLRLDHVDVANALLTDRGFSLKYFWPENRFVDGETPTAFVLADPAGREIDIHAAHISEDGTPEAAWECDFVFAAEDFLGEGSIAEVAVHCMSAPFQIRTHTGYELKEKDHHDIRLLREVLDRT